MGYQVFMNQKIWKNELNLFSYLYKNSPGYKTANAYGSALSKNNYLDQAEKVLRDGLRFDDTQAGIWYELSMISYRRNDIPRTKNLLLRAAGSKKPDSEVFNNLGNIYFMQKDLKNAELNYLRSLNLRPSNFQAMYNLGNIFSLKGEKEKSLLWFRRFISTAPDSEEYNGLKTRLRSLPGIEN